MSSWRNARKSPLDPKFCSLTEHFCLVASERYVYVWQFARQQSVKGREQKMQKELISLREAVVEEKVLDVEDGSSLPLNEFREDDELHEGPYNSNNGVREGFVRPVKERRRSTSMPYDTEAEMYP